MMDAAIVTVRKSVVARIEAKRPELVTKEFTLEGSYADWPLDLKQTDIMLIAKCDELRIDVATHGSLQRIGMSSRGSVQYSVPVDIAIRFKFGQDKQNDDTGRIKTEEIDKLLLLQEQIHLLFTQQRLTDSQLTVWDGDGGGTNPLWSPNLEHLRQWRQFSGLIRVFFRVDVKLAA